MGKSNYQKLLENLYNGIYYVDRNMVIKYWNNGAERITGFPKEEILGKKCSENLILHKTRDGKNLCELNCILDATLKDGHVHEIEAYLQHKNGSWIPVSIRVAPMYDSYGRIVGATKIFSDNKMDFKSINKDEEYIKVAFYDELTHLVNKKFIEMKVYSKLHELKRYEWPFGIIFFEIDKFDRIRKSYGEKIANSVLKMVTGALLTRFRPFDTLGRWDGDEFTALIVNVNEEHLFMLAERFREVIEKLSMPLGKGNIKVTVSVGTTLAITDDNTASLVNRAEKLKNDSLESGGNKVSKA